ncbi:MAG: hypothetical protein EAX90_04880 [Candidatus Heimdallarchaeota archaeon]|nr:hypothetical protein [Candidatus Heimdallarchaeota archaeon]
MLRFKKSLLLCKKEILESFKSKEVILVITILPLTFAVLMPLTIPLMTLTLPDDPTELDDFENFPALVPYWDELDSKGKFLVFYSMMYFEMFLLVPMILPLVIAADSIAGERERKTLESIIASPLSTWEILIGKLFTTLIPSTIITWLSGIIFMVICDATLYRELGRLLFPNTMSLILLFGFSPFMTLITTQSMVIVSTRASGMREAQQIGSLAVLPLYSFILGETALLILVSIWYVFIGIGIILVCSIILLLINLKLFDREYMISSIKS